MNKQQNIDSDECVEMEEHGETKDCCGCSCNICLLQENYLSLTQLYEEIDKEIIAIQEKFPLGALALLNFKTHLSYIG